MKQWKKKTLALAMSLCLIWGMLPMAGMAEEAPESPQAGNVSSPEEFQDALSNEVSEIVMGDDITLTDYVWQVTSGQDLTLDLKGYTLTIAQSDPKSEKVIGVLVIKNGGKLTVQDSSETANGKLEITSPWGIEIIGNTAYTDGNAPKEEAAVLSTLTLKSGTITAGTNTATVKLFGNGATLNVEGGAVTNTFKNAEFDGNFAVAGNGSRSANTEPDKNIDYGGIRINISGGEITSAQDCALYLPGYHDTVISGGTIKGWAGIEMDSGNLEITGGTIVSTYEGDGNRKYKEKGDGNYNFGTALAIVSKGSQAATGYYGHMNIDISGGSFISPTYYAVDEYNLAHVQNSQNPSNAYVDSLSITGGTFSGDGNKGALLSDNWKAIGEGFVTGGTYSSDVSQYVAAGYVCTETNGGYVVIAETDAAASVENKYYATLADAVAAAQSGNTVVLKKDIEENITIASGKNITLDLNGKILNGGTTSGKAALTNEGTVVILDSTSGGMIKRADVNVPGYYVIDNQGTMTIESGSVYNHTGIAPQGASLIRNAGKSTAASLTIDGGEITQDGFIAVKNDDRGVLKITGGTITATGSEGRTVISAVQNWAQATISGGTINGAVWTSVWSAEFPNSKTVIEGENTVVNGVILARCEPGYEVGDKKPEVEVKSGSYKVTWATDTNASVTISGGDFTALPSKYILAEGKAVLPSTKQGYVYAIGKKPDTQVVPAKPKVETAVTDPALETVVEEAAAALAAETTALEGQGLEVQINELAQNNKDDPKNYVDDLGVADPDAISIVVQPFMDISITGAADGSGDETLTLDIQPMHRTVATTADLTKDDPIVVEDGMGKNAVVIGGPAPLNVTGLVTVSLSLPTRFVDGANTLYVNHEKNGKKYIYTGTVSGDVLTFSNPHGFSEFTITKVAPAATIGGVGYATLQEAADAVQNGEVITVRKEGEYAKVSRTVTFYAEADPESLTYTIEAGANTTAAADNGTNGKYVFTRNSSGGGEEEPEEWVNPFDDVKEKDWFYDAVKYASENGLFLGTEDTVFAPAKDMERGMLVTVLYRLEGEPKAERSSFTDVSADAYYAAAVGWAASHDIVTGYGNGKFGPKDSVTREQLACVLYRYAAYKGWDVTGSASLEKFSDGAKASGWAETALAWAVDAGILQGYGNNLLNPEGSATRAEVAQMFLNFCGSYWTE